MRSIAAAKTLRRKMGVGNASALGPVRFCQLGCLLMNVLVVLWQQPSNGNEAGLSSSTNREFSIKGVVKKIDRENGRVVIAHQAVPNFMDAMTMPFRVKDATGLELIQ